MPELIANMLSGERESPQDAPVIHFKGKPVEKVKTAWRKLRVR